MKTIFFLLSTCAITFASHFSYAQENRSIEKKGLPPTGNSKSIKNKLSVFASGGTTLASSNMKDSSFIGSGWNVEGGIYIPLLFNRKGWDGSVKGGQPARYINKGNIKDNFTIGVEAGINYAHHKNDGGQSLYSNNFRLSNGNGGETPLFEKAAKYYANSFQFFAGPKAEWSLNKIFISPSALLGYISVNRKGYTLGESIANPRQPTENKYIPFITSTRHTSSGFVIKPKIELGYHFTEQLSLFASAAIAFGPAIQNNFSFWKPQVEKGNNNIYSYDQFVNGTAKSTVLNSRWQTTSINAGLRYTWIKHSFDKGHDSRKQRTATAEIGQDMQSTANLQSAVKPGSTTKQGGAVSSSYAAGRSVAQTDSSKNAEIPGRLSMTPTTTRQTQSSTFGEKVASGMQSGANIVQTDNTNKAETPSRLSMTPTTTRQTQSSTFGEKVASGLQSGAQMIAGQPIPGIVVKGGKNRTAELITAVSKDNGEVELNNLEKGNYLFQLTGNSNQQDKVIVRGWNPEKKENITSSVNETNDSTGNGAALVAGNPIPGIIVKGGKNPGASFTMLTVNNDGQIGFKVLQPGNYKLIIETPGNNTSGIDNSKKKTASGIQNVLKTRHETAKNSISNVR